MFKNIFAAIFALITNPVTAWKDLSARDEDENQDGFLKSFVYPVLGVTSLVAFVTCMWANREYDVQTSLKETIAVLVSYFLGYYFALFLFEKGLVRFFPELENGVKRFHFIGYCLSVLMAISIVILLINFTFFRFAPLYIAYIIWEGAREYWGITDDNKRMAFVGAASTILIAAPWLIKKILYMMIN